MAAHTPPCVLWRISGRRTGETTARILSPPARADSPTSLLQGNNSPWVSSVISLDDVEGPITLKSQTGFANDLSFV